MSGTGDPSSEGPGESGGESVGWVSALPPESATPRGVVNRYNAFAWKVVKCR